MAASPAAPSRPSPRAAVPRRAAIAAALVGTAALAVAAFRTGSPERPPDAGPVARSAYPSAPPAPPAVGPGPVASRSATATITQIMIAYRTDRGVSTVTRTRAQAYELAVALIERIEKGESMESLLQAHTDDRGEDGKPFNRGSYTFAPSTPALPVIRRAAFDTPIGKLAPEPVDSGFAYHVIRRDE